MKEEKQATGRKRRKKEKTPYEKRNFNFLYLLSGLRLQIKKPVVIQTFPSPHLTGKGRCEQQRAIKSKLVCAGEMYLKDRTVFNIIKK